LFTFNNILVLEFQNVFRLNIQSYPDGFRPANIS